MIDAPIKEVSGVCIADGWVIIIGDDAPVLAAAPWTPDLSAPWTLIDVAALPGAPKGTGQFEAVEHLSGATVGVLCEDPPLLLAVDLTAREVIGHWELVVDLRGLRKKWRKDAGSRGEGMVFGPDRVFVVKEKKPAAIIEFGPPGADSAGTPRPGAWEVAPGTELHAVRHRELDFDDISDATVADGRVWLVSDQERLLIDVTNERTWRLPKHIKKPEGLARTPDGRWLVASDNKSGKRSLHLVRDEELRPEHA